MEKMKIKLKKISVIAILTCVFATCCGAFGDTVTLAPTDDTYVNQQWAASSFGTAITMGIGYATGTPANRQGWIYLKFGLDSIPDGATITSATIYLYKPYVNTNNDFIAGIYNVDNDSWTENTITWNNKPDTATTATDNQSITSANVQWYSWDVTTLVTSNNINGDDILSLCLKENPQQTTINTWTAFASSNYATLEYHPYITITYTNVPEPVTISLLGIGGIGLLFSKRSSHI